MTFDPYFGLDHDTDGFCRHQQRRLDAANATLRRIQLVVGPPDAGQALDARVAAIVAGLRHEATEAQQDAAVARRSATGSARLSFGVYLALVLSLVVCAALAGEVVTHDCLSGAYPSSVEILP